MAMTDLPPAYDNLCFDPEYTEPKAPLSDEDLNLEQGSRETLEIPTAPVLELLPEIKILNYNLQALNFEDIYDACITHVQQHCCYGSKFVKQMQLTDIMTTGCFYYTLESFCERRETADLVEPFHGQPIDGPENGPRPNPWDIYAKPSELFKDEKIRIEIPHTAYVRTCQNCHGCGHNRCTSCCGSGYNRCTSCSGSGRDSDGDSCTWCSGAGGSSCSSCSGSGRVKCSKCEGSGKLKHCKILIVTWKNFQNEAVSYTGKLPPQLVTKAKGDCLFSEEGERLLPVANAPDADINISSTQLIQQHRVSFPDQRILMQRQYLSMVPVTRTCYKWKEKEGEFYVYGLDRVVYFKKYPQQCCCCTCF